MSDLTALKARFKSFFKLKDSTEDSVTILEKFVMPFAAKYQGTGTHEDEMIESFFNVANRHIHEVITNRDFKMPGGLLLTGARYGRGIGDRTVKAGQKMLLVLDKKDNTGKVMYKVGPKEVEYLLEKHEIDTIKDWLDVIK